MASTIKVNNIQNQCGANIVNKCSTTITLGASGDNIVLASGATQSGFGRTGTVDWDTTAKTAGFTAVSGTGYFVNTTSGAVTMTLPATPSAGDIVSVKDYANTFDTNNLTIGRNGQPISGESIDAVISTEGQALTLVYVDATKGWQSVAAATESDLPKPGFITATGGTITTCGDFKIHTFTGPGTFTVSQVATNSNENTVGYMVVAGGGGGGGAYIPSNQSTGAGGGAGGFREGRNVPIDNFTASPLVADAPTNAVTVTAQAYPITVGGGGTGGAANSPICSDSGGGGSNSVFSTITSTGGGGGGRVKTAGNPGGSGGGGGGESGGPVISGGAGNTPPVSPPQGTQGGPATSGGPQYGSGGGGGAISSGTNGTSTSASGCGGNGATTSISATPTAYAGGGGGGMYNIPACQPQGGTGGGGNGSLRTISANTAGTVNTGGGGGGSTNSTPGAGSAGGSGIVIIRYKFQ